MHGGDQGDLLGPAPGDPTRVEGPNHGMGPGGGERGPVQDPTHRGPTVPDPAAPLEPAAVAVEERATKAARASGGMVCWHRA